MKGLNEIGMTNLLLLKILLCKLITCTDGLKRYAFMPSSKEKAHEKKERRAFEYFACV